MKDASTTGESINGNTYIFSQTPDGCEVFINGNKVAIITTPYIPWRTIWDCFGSPTFVEYKRAPNDRTDIC